MQSHTSATCNERHRLAEEFATAIRVYSDAVVNLTQQVGRISEKDYFRIRDAVEDARRRPEEARIAFERFTAEHGCGRCTNCDGNICSLHSDRVRRAGV